MPLASTTHMSLVEVSPSTVTRLKVRGTISWRASWSSSWVMAQSVVTKQSMVPMLGWIMPEPLAMAPMVTVLPPMVQVTAISFFTVSVVMMAWAASSEPSSDSAAAAAGSPRSMAAMFSSWPITPVEATTKSPGFRPVAAAASCAHPLRVLMALGCAGVGVAGVGHDAPGLAVLQVVHGHIQGRRLYPVHGVDGRRRALLLGEDQARSFLPARSILSWGHGWLPSPFPLFTPQWTPAACKSLGGGHAAGYLLHCSHFPPIHFTSVQAPRGLTTPASDSYSAPPRRTRPCPGCQSGR